MDPSFKPAGEGNPLINIREGVEVYDREGELVGRAEKVYLGSVPPREAARGAGPAEVDEPDMAREGCGIPWRRYSTRSTSWKKICAPACGEAVLSGLRVRA